MGTVGLFWLFQQIFLRGMHKEWGVIQGDGYNRIVLMIPADVSEEDAQGMGFDPW